MNEGPRALALLICDQAFQQAGTNEWHLIGIFDQILVRSLPAKHSPLVAFCSLEGFGGEAFVTATIRDNVGDVVFALRAMMPKLPANVFEFAFPFPPVEFKKPGSYTLEMHAGEQLVAMRSFHVRVVEPPPGTPAG
jgi:hypothetical protein